MSLITLKTVMQIASIAGKLEFSSAKIAIESIKGRIADLSDLTEVEGKDILGTLTKQYKRNEARNKLKIENSIPSDTKPKSKSVKKEIMIID